MDPYVLRRIGDVTIERVLPKQDQPVTDGGSAPSPVAPNRSVPSSPAGSILPSGQYASGAGDSAVQDGANPTTPAELHQPFAVKNPAPNRSKSAGGVGSGYDESEEEEEEEEFDEDFSEEFDTDDNDEKVRNPSSDAYKPQSQQPPYSNATKDWRLGGGISLDSVQRNTGAPEPAANFDPRSGVPQDHTGLRSPAQFKRTSDENIPQTTPLPNKSAYKLGSSVSLETVRPPVRNDSAGVRDFKPYRDDFMPNLNPANNSNVGIIDNSNFYTPTAPVTDVRPQPQPAPAASAASSVESNYRLNPTVSLVKVNQPPPLPLNQMNQETAITSSSSATSFMGGNSVGAGSIDNTRQENPMSGYIDGSANSDIVKKQQQQQKPPPPMSDFTGGLKPIHNSDSNSSASASESRDVANISTFNSSSSRDVTNISGAFNSPSSRMNAVGDSNASNSVIPPEYSSEKGNNYDSGMMMNLQSVGVANSVSNPTPYIPVDSATEQTQQRQEDPLTRPRVSTYVENHQELQRNVAPSPVNDFKNYKLGSSVRLDVVRPPPSSSTKTNDSNYSDNNSSHSFSMQNMATNNAGPKTSSLTDADIDDNNTTADGINTFKNFLRYDDNSASMDFKLGSSVSLNTVKPPSLANDGTRFSDRSQSVSLGAEDSDGFKRSVSSEFRLGSGVSLDVVKPKADFKLSSDISIDVVKPPSTISSSHHNSIDDEDVDPETIAARIANSISGCDINNEDADCEDAQNRPARKDEEAVEKEQKGSKTDEEPESEEELYENFEDEEKDLDGEALQMGLLDKEIKMEVDADLDMMKVKEERMDPEEEDDGGTTADDESEEKQTSKRKMAGSDEEAGSAEKERTKKKKTGTADDETDSDSDSEKGDKSTVERKMANLRRNIREVMDESQLDAATLNAQRQEMERLRRVQEQHRIIREVQKQIQMNKQNSKTQTRVISLLQGNTSVLKSGMPAPQSPASSGSPSSNTVVVKLSSGSGAPQIVNKKVLEMLRNQKGAATATTNTSSKVTSLTRNLLNKPHMMTPSVSIAPVKPKSPAPIEDEQLAAIRKVTGKGKGKDVVTISSSSSDEDDCILISEPSGGEEEEEEEDPTNSGMHTNDLYNVPDEQGRVMINVGRPENEPEVFLAPQISRVIKPHQIGGVRFLFDNVVESLERFKTSSGFGCILAHSMGLGKTLQVVSFCDVFLRHTDARTVLCIMPINTLQNWLAEFNMWLPVDPANCPLAAHGEVRPRNFPIFVLNDLQKTITARGKVVAEWSKQGGVLLIGYELYRQLSLKRPRRVRRGKKKFNQEEEIVDDKNKPLLEEMHTALVKPGPDLIICDEGHRIKNSHASISQALKQIRSKRRVVLTGYPLQNNLLEYWCMVDFVRPNYLGTKTEFSNMFERPIQNGQCIDSTPQDIRLMRYRAHVLHSLLEGFVQRRSHSVLTNTLPQKEEYVMLVRMSSFQRKLYDTFMNEVVRTKAVPNPLKAFAVCCKIWNHPDVLYQFLKKRSNCGEAVDLDLDETAPIVPCGTPNIPGSMLAPGMIPSISPAPGNVPQPVTKRGRGRSPKNASSPSPVKRERKKAGQANAGQQLNKSPAIAAVIPNTTSNNGGSNSGVNNNGQNQMNQQQVGPNSSNQQPHNDPSGNNNQQFPNQQGQQYGSNQFNQYQNQQQPGPYPGIMGGDYNQGGYNQQPPPSNDFPNQYQPGYQNQQTTNTAGFNNSGGTMYQNFGNYYPQNSSENSNFNNNPNYWNNSYYNNENQNNFFSGNQFGNSETNPQNWNQDATNFQQDPTNNYNQGFNSNNPGFSGTPQNQTLNSTSTATAGAHQQKPQQQQGTFGNQQKIDQMNSQRSQNTTQQGMTGTLGSGTQNMQNTGPQMASNTPDSNMMGGTSQNVMDSSQTPQGMMGNNPNSVTGNVMGSGSQNTPNTNMMGSGPQNISNAPNTNMMGPGSQGMQNIANTSSHSLSNNQNLMGNNQNPQGMMGSMSTNQGSSSMMGPQNMPNTMGTGPQSMQNFNMMGTGPQNVTNQPSNPGMMGPTPQNMPNSSNMGMIGSGPQNMASNPNSNMMTGPPNMQNPGNMMTGNHNQQSMMGGNMQNTSNSAMGSAPHNMMGNNQNPQNIMGNPGTGSNQQNMSNTTNNMLGNGPPGMMSNSGQSYGQNNVMDSQNLMRNIPPINNNTNAMNNSINNTTGSNTTNQPSMMMQASQNMTGDLQGNNQTMMNTNQNIMGNNMNMSQTNSLNPHHNNQNLMDNAQSQQHMGNVSGNNPPNNMMGSNPPSNQSNTIGGSMHGQQPQGMMQPNMMQNNQNPMMNQMMGGGNQGSVNNNQNMMGGLPPNNMMAPPIQQQQPNNQQHPMIGGVQQPGHSVQGLIGGGHQQPPPTQQNPMLNHQQSLDNSQSFMGNMHQQANQNMMGPQHQQMPPSNAPNMMIHNNQQQPQNLPTQSSSQMHQNQQGNNQAFNTNPQDNTTPFHTQMDSNNLHKPQDQQQNNSSTSGMYHSQSSYPMPSSGHHHPTSQQQGNQPQPQMGGFGQSSHHQNQQQNQHDGILDDLINSASNNSGLSTGQDNSSSNNMMPTKGSGGMNTNMPGSITTNLQQKQTTLDQQQPLQNSQQFNRPFANDPLQQQPNQSYHSDPSNTTSNYSNQGQYNQPDLMGGYQGMSSSSSSTSVSGNHHQPNTFQSNNTGPNNSNQMNSQFQTQPPHGTMMNNYQNAPHQQQQPFDNSSSSIGGSSGPQGTGYDNLLPNNNNGGYPQQQQQNNTFNVYNNSNNNSGSIQHQPPNTSNTSSADFQGAGFGAQGMNTNYGDNKDGLQMGNYTNNPPKMNEFGNFDQQWGDMKVNKEDMSDCKMKAEDGTSMMTQEEREMKSCGNQTEDKLEVKAETMVKDTSYSFGEMKEVVGGMKDAATGQDEKDDVKDMATSTAIVKSGKEDPGIPYDWAERLLKGYIPGDIEASAKMAILFCILEESMSLGDRILVFSQSLFTLNLIEEFLQKSNLPDRSERWARNWNYYRLDGSTSALEREKLINEFNSNPNIHLFLVSTRAGSLGINLVGANRVIVFDASWNPCHDTQAVCRVYRYGQKKPCFVYRLVMDNCLEKKIYDRQINKQGMADRVVDECNPDAHLSIKEVTNLCWDSEEIDSKPSTTMGNIKDKYIDVVMQKVLDRHGSVLSKEPFQHESLLVDRKDKKLSQAEKRLAKRSYELEKQANINSSRPVYGYSGVGNQPGLQIRPTFRAIRGEGAGGVVNKPMASVRPMQSELSSQLVRDTGRPRSWIPAEVWQKQGMSAQEMTLPLDVVIPTNSPDRSSIVLKAGQKVMVLKSPKGIYMQLENGKIIAIRTAIKVGNKGEKKVDKRDFAFDTKKEVAVQPSRQRVQNMPMMRNNISIIPRGGGNTGISSRGGGAGGNKPLVRMLGNNNNRPWGTQKQPIATTKPYFGETPPVTVTVTKKKADASVSSMVRTEVRVERDANVGSHESKESSRESSTDNMGELLNMDDFSHSTTPDSSKQQQRGGESASESSRQEPMSSSSSFSADHDDKESSSMGHHHHPHHHTQNTMSDHERMRMTTEEELLHDEDDEDYDDDDEEDDMELEQHHHHGHHALPPHHMSRMLSSPSSSAAAPAPSSNTAHGQHQHHSHHQGHPSHQHHPISVDHHLSGNKKMAPSASASRGEGMMSSSASSSSHHAHQIGVSGSSTSSSVTSSSSTGMGHGHSSSSGMSHGHSSSSGMNHGHPSSSSGMSHGHSSSSGMGHGHSSSSSSSSGMHTGAGSSMPSAAVGAAPVERENRHHHRDHMMLQQQAPPPVSNVMPVRPDENDFNNHGRYPPNVSQKLSDHSSVPTQSSNPQLPMQLNSSVTVSPITSTPAATTMPLTSPGMMTSSMSSRSAVSINPVANQPVLPLNPAAPSVSINPVPVNSSPYHHNPIPPPVSSGASAGRRYTSMEYTADSLAKSTEPAFPPALSHLKTMSDHSISIFPVDSSKASTAGGPSSTVTSGSPYGADFNYRQDFQPRHTSSASSSVGRDYYPGFNQPQIGGYPSSASSGYYPSSTVTSSSASQRKDGGKESSYPPMGGSSGYDTPSYLAPNPFTAAAVGSGYPARTPFPPSASATSASSFPQSAPPPPGYSSAVAGSSELSRMYSAFHRPEPSGFQPPPSAQGAPVGPVVPPPPPAVPPSHQYSPYNYNPFLMQPHPAYPPHHMPPPAPPGSQQNAPPPQ